MSTYEHIVTFYASVAGNAHTTPEKFENAALFLRLDLTSTLIRHENRAFPKRWRRNLKTPASSIRVDGNILKTELFENNSKMTDNCCVFKFLRRSAHEKHLMYF